MDKQLTPAAELRVYYKAATILAERLAAQSDGDCPNPEKFDPYGACASPSTDLCGKCFRNHAISKATQEVITDKLEADICQSDVNVISDELRRIWLPYTERKVAEARAESVVERDRLRAVVAELRKELRSVYADGNDRVDELSKENVRLRAALENAESALSLAHHRKQYDLVEGALRKVCSALGNCRAVGGESAGGDL